MPTKLTQAEARKLVPRLDWQAAPRKTEWGDMVQATVPLGKDDTMSVYAPREIVEKLTVMPAKVEHAKAPQVRFQGQVKHPVRGTWSNFSGTELTQDDARDNVSLDLTGNRAARILKQTTVFEVVEKVTS